MRQSLDLNADLGEGCAFDEALMKIVSSCSIACGGHAGDIATMRTALQLAKVNKVSAGAHPSFPDRESFGRAKSTLFGAALEQALTDQVLALKTLSEALDIRLAHLKPHGALYNMAAQDPDLAKSIVAVTLDTLPKAAIFGPPMSELQKASIKAGVRFVPEGFADRTYETGGHLRDRNLPGALIHDPADQTEQSLQLARTMTVTSYNNQEIPLSVDTICLHGDSPNALAAAKSIKSALLVDGFTICPPN